MECHKIESERKLLRTLKTSHLQFMIGKTVKSVVGHLFSAELLESLQCFLKNPSAEKGIVKASRSDLVFSVESRVSPTHVLPVIK